MVIERCKKPEDFLGNLFKYNYDKITTFLYYPKYESVDTRPKYKNAEITNNNIFKKSNLNINKADPYDEKIYNNNFIKNIKWNNGIIFVGLNAASRDTQTNDNHKYFQTMHDANVNGKSSQGRDFILADNIMKTDKAKGSFAFDIINNFPATDLTKHIKRLCDNIENDSEDYSKFIPESLININDLPYKNSNDMQALKDNGNIDDELLKHIKQWDIPIFIGILKMLMPKKVVCIGKNSYSIVNRIVNKTNVQEKLNLHLDIENIPHNSAQKFSVDGKSKILNAQFRLDILQKVIK